MCEKHLLLPTQEMGVKTPFAFFVFVKIIFPQVTSSSADLITFSARSWQIALKHSCPFYITGHY
jgi:hypothetical protein